MSPLPLTPWFAFRGCNLPFSTSFTLLSQSHPTIAPFSLVGLPGGTKRPFNNPPRVLLGEFCIVVSHLNVKIYLGKFCQGKIGYTMKRKFPTANKSVDSISAVFSSPVFEGVSAGSFPEQRLVIKPNKSVIRYELSIVQLATPLLG